MPRYQIKYKNAKGKVITAISRAENAEDAFYKYANRVVFGRNTIFCNCRLKMLDADTMGMEWAIFMADHKLIFCDKI